MLPFEIEWDDQDKIFMEAFRAEPTNTSILLCWADYITDQRTDTESEAVRCLAMLGVWPENDFSPKSTFRWWTEPRIIIDHADHILPYPIFRQLRGSQHRSFYFGPISWSLNKAAFSTQVSFGYASFEDAIKYFICAYDAAKNVNWLLRLCGYGFDIKKCKPRQRRKLDPCEIPGSNKVWFGGRDGAFFEKTPEDDKTPEGAIKVAGCLIFLPKEK